MYSIYKVPNDSYDDPPKCGIRLSQITGLETAMDYADKVCHYENDTDSAYFVVSSDTFQHIYSTGLINAESS